MPLRDKSRYQSEEWKEYQRNYQRSWYQRHRTKRLARIYERKAATIEYVQELKVNSAAQIAVSVIQRRYNFTM